MSIIIKPIVTEKATLLTEKLNRYSFKVNKDANKIQIKKAVEAAYVNEEFIGCQRHAFRVPHGV